MSAQSLLHFDGTSHYVDFETVLNFNGQDFSLEAWVFIEKTSGVNRILSSERTNVSKNQFALIQNQDTVAFMMRGVAKGPSLWVQKKHVLKAQVPAKQWTHVAVVRKGTLHQLFINGTLSVEHKTASPIKYQKNQVKLRIGAQHAQSGNGALQFFGGKVADVRIWSVALSPEEISDRRHHCLKGDESGLLVYWPLNEGKGNRVTDVVTQATGTIKGATWQPEDVDFLRPKPQSEQSQPNIPTTVPVLTFDGNSYVTVKKTPTLTTAVTIEFWAKGANSLADQTFLLWALTAKGNRVLNIHFPWKHTLDTRIFWDVGNDSGCDRIEKAVAIKDYNEWTHWAFTKEVATGAMRICRNGELWHKGNGHTRPLTDIKTFLVGAHQAGTGAWKGAIADFRIWDVALSCQQVRDRMHQRLTGNEPGLVVYWPLDEGNGTAIADKTGNGCSGTVSNATWETATLNWSTENDLSLTPARSEDTNASGAGATDSQPTLMNGSPQSVLTFNGTSNYIDTGLDAQPSALPSTTWEAWVKPSHGPASWDMMLSTDDGGWDRFVGERGGQFQVSHGSGAWAAASSDVNEWQHIAIAYTSDQHIRFYKNGVETVFNGTSSFGSTTKSFCIGRSAGNAEQCYQGSIGEVRVWDYARPQSEIQQDMYSRLTGQEEGLVGYWPLTEGSGTTVTNKVTNTQVPTNDATWETDQLPAAPLQQNNEESPITKPNSALTFANTRSPSDYVIVNPFDKSPTHALTVEFWIKVSKNGRGNGTPLGISTPRLDNEFIIYGCKNITIYVHGSAKGSSVSFQTDQWQHFAVTWESQTGQAHLYIDGESVHSISLAKGAVLDSNGILVLGQEQDSYGGSFDVNQAFQGEMAEVRLWNDVRSPEEIKALMNHRCTGTEEGLVGYWPLDEGDGEVAKDKTSNGNDGALHGVTWSTEDDLSLTPAPSEDTNASGAGATDSQPTLMDGSPQSVLGFNGGSSYIDTGLDAQPSALPNMTWEAWIKPSQGPAPYDVILSTDDGGWDRGVAERDGKFQIYYGKGPWAATSVDVNKWQHIAVVYTSDQQLRFYKDGIEFVLDKKSSFGSTTNSFFIGRSSQNPQQYYQGRICEVRVWDYARPQSEIQQDMYSRLTGQEEGLVGYWPLTEGSGDTVTNKVTNTQVSKNNTTWETDQLPASPEAPTTSDDAAPDAAEPGPTQVMSFDGSHDYIESPYQATLNPESFTISCWAKVTGGQGQWRSPVTCRADYPQRGYIIYAGTNNKWQFWIGIGSNWLPIHGADIVLDQWVHIAGTYDGKVMQLYVDSQPAGAPQAGTLSLNPDRPLRIGAGTTEAAASLFFHGQIAEVRLWDHARSQAEIQADMSRRMTGTEPGLVGYWPLDGQDSAVANNLANPDCPGTIHDATAVVADNLNLAPAPSVPDISNETAPDSSDQSEVVADASGATDGDTTDGTSESALVNVLYFDGQDDYVEVPTNPSLDLTDSYTIEAWIKPTGLGGRVVDKAIGGQSEGFTFDTYPQNLRFINKGTCLSSPEPLTLGTWQHVAVTFENIADGAKLFVDGDVVQTATPSQVGSVTNLPVRFGSQADALGSLYTGEIAEVRIWNVVRSPEDIKQARYHRLQKDEPGLVGYWPLGAGGGAIAPDQSSQDNDGSLSGASWQESDLPIEVAPDAPVDQDSISDLTAGTNDAPEPITTSLPSSRKTFGKIVYLKVDGSDKRSRKSKRKKRKKRKKQTFSAYEKYVRKIASRQSDAASIYVKRHERSNRKKKNGWLKDFVKNYSKSLAKLYKL